MQTEQQMHNTVVEQKEKAKKLKALANDILAKCQEQELSYAEMRDLIIMLSGRLESVQIASTAEDLSEILASMLSEQKKTEDGE